MVKKGISYKTELKVTFETKKALIEAVKSGKNFKLSDYWGFCPTTYWIKDLKKHMNYWNNTYLVIPKLKTRSWSAVLVVDNNGQVRVK